MNEGSPPRVGVIGIGCMGLPMALRLRERGHAVVVRDVDPAREALARAEGLEVLPSASALGAACDAIVVAVVDAAQCDLALFGGGDGGGGDSGRYEGGGGAAAALVEARPAGAPPPAVILCPTIAPESVERVARRLLERGIDCIDAPMSGGPARARDGSMSLMVAGGDAAFARSESLLSALSANVFRVGTRPGDGARTKLVNNLLAAVNLAGAAEALALAERLGLDARTTLDVIERSSGQSWIGGDRLRRALAGDTEPRARTTLLAKDSRLAIEAAKAVSFDAALGSAAMRVFADAAASPRYSALDDSSLLAMMRERGAGPG